MKLENVAMATRNDAGLRALAPVVPLRKLRGPSRPSRWACIFRAALPLLVLAWLLAGSTQANTLLDFWNPSCGPCMQMKPTIDQLVREGYQIRSINTFEDQATAQRFGVTVVPTFVLVDASGQSPRSREGVQSRESIIAMTRTNVLKAADQSQQFGQQQGPQQIADPFNVPVDPLDPSKQQRWNDPYVVKIRNSMTGPQGQQGKDYGSGCVINIDGQNKWVLTCGHATSGPNDPVLVIFNDGQQQVAVTRQWIHDQNSGQGADVAILEFKSAVEMRIADCEGGPEAPGETLLPPWLSRGQRLLLLHAASSRPLRIRT
jgi:thiol-disulfide isomerase/thioredoxin